jgi:hypothetical protein
MADGKEYSFAFSKTRSHMFILDLPVQAVNRPFGVTHLQAHADRCPSTALTQRCWVDSLRAFRMALRRAEASGRFKQLQTLLCLSKSRPSTQFTSLSSCLPQ